VPRSYSCHRWCQRARTRARNHSVGRLRGESCRPLACRQSRSAVWMRWSSRAFEAKVSMAGLESTPG